MAPRLDLAGQRFGRLVAISGRTAAGFDRGKMARVWLCQCDCGNQTEVRTASLRSGNTKSCGCINLERMEAESRSRMKHGERQTRLWKKWNEMQYRCAKGLVEVCSEWREFTAFRAWALGAGYKPGHARQQFLTRRDTAKGFSPKNCYFSGKRPSAAKRSNARRIEYDGRTWSLAELARHAGITRFALAYRLKAGWSVEDAVETEKRPWSRKSDERFHDVAGRLERLRAEAKANHKNMIGRS